MTFDRIDEDILWSLSPASLKLQDEDTPKRYLPSQILDYMRVTWPILVTTDDIELYDGRIIKGVSDADVLDFAVYYDSFISGDSSQEIRFELDADQDAKSKLQVYRDKVFNSLHIYRESGLTKEYAFSEGDEILIKGEWTRGSTVYSFEIQGIVTKDLGAGSYIVSDITGLSLLPIYLGDPGFYESTAGLSTSVSVLDSTSVKHGQSRRFLAVLSKLIQEFFQIIAKLFRLRASTDQDEEVLLSQLRREFSLILRKEGNIQNLLDIMQPFKLKGTKAFVRWAIEYLYGWELLSVKTAANNLILLTSFGSATYSDEEDSLGEFITYDSSLGNGSFSKLTININGDTNPDYSRKRILLEKLAQEWLVISAFEYKNIVGGVEQAMPDFITGE